MAINLYIVRHGETYFNFLHRFQGWSDAPLTSKGIQHGLDAGSRLANIHFDGVYSSDLTRAIHTARYILKIIHPTLLLNHMNCLTFESNFSVRLKALTVKLLQLR